MTARDLTWLRLNCPDASAAEDEAFIERVAILTADEGFSGEQARKLALDILIKNRKNNA